VKFRFIVSKTITGFAVKLIRRNRKMKMKFTQSDIGKRVRLPENQEEGWNEEFGTIIGIQEEHEVLTINLDEKFKRDEFDDGIRETAFEDAELE
jgi:hypothetical protein